MKVGYARVSTRDQNLQLQMDALENAGCERIYSDKLSATKERPGLDDALGYVREGDTLVIWKLDRLGRSVRDLIEIVDQLRERGVAFQSTTDAIDTNTPAGRFFFHVMAALAQMERELLIERTMAGLDAARRQGRYGGRPRAFDDEGKARAIKMLTEGYSYRDMSEELGVSVQTLYRYFPAARWRSK